MHFIVTKDQATISRYNHFPVMSSPANLLTFSKLANVPPKCYKCAAGRKMMSSITDMQ